MWVELRGLWLGSVFKLSQVENVGGASRDAPEFLGMVEDHAFSLRILSPNLPVMGPTRWNVWLDVATWFLPISVVRKPGPCRGSVVVFLYLQCCTCPSLWTREIRIDTMSP